MEWSAYIPMDRRQAMVAGQELPARTSGAALFADISGFTPLTELLAEELGPRRGAEELTGYLDRIYDALVAEVHQYTGSVIGFSGDAITCWFDVDDGLRATACALRMQGRMGQFGTLSTPKGTSVSLTLKVALVTGPVRRFLVGDPQMHNVDVLAGATMDRLASAGERTRAGEVTIESGAALRLKDRVEVRGWRGGTEMGGRLAIVAGLARPVDPAPWPVAPPPTEAQVRPWLLLPVYENLRAAQGQFLAELRPVTALFLKFGGLDYDQDEAAGEKLNAYICWVQQVLARYGGFLVQLTTGDKGSYLYAAFGAPVTHDDDAIRAVAAGDELRSPPSELDFIDSTQIGISQGRAWTGAYGGQPRRTYGVLGDEVNIAARLMSKATPGQVLVSSRVADAVAERYDLEALGSISLKGKRAPVSVSSLLGSRSLSPRRPISFFKSSLVGRETELAQMKQVQVSALAGSGQILCLSGTAGIGKSHLAASFVEHALDRGFSLAMGACQSISQTVAYTPWRRIFRALLGLADEPDAARDRVSSAARQVAHLEELVADMNPDWLLRLPLLGDLLGLLTPDNETTGALDPQLRQESLHALAVEIIGVLAGKRPLLLLIEDAHWMDEASSGLTLSMGRAIGSVPVLLILVCRLPVGQAASPFPALEQLPHYNSLDLQELAPQETERMIADHLGSRPSSLVLSLVHAFAQGNPFFAEELVNALRDTERIYRREDGVWALADEMVDILRRANCLKRQNGGWDLVEGVQLTAADLDIPDSIHGVVLSRIDRLQEHHKVTLKVAGVVGRVFEFDVLANSHPTHPGHAELSEQMDILEARDFARLETEYPQLIYAFKHAITQEVAYQALPERQKRQLHGAVGKALEGLQPDAIERLAYHYRCGGMRDKALFYLDKAAHKAQREYANETALNYYDQALALEERWEWLKGKIEVLHVLGRREEEETALEQLEKISGTPVFDVAYLLGQYHEARGEYQSAQANVEKALTACQDLPEEVDRVRCLIQLGAISGRQGRLSQAEEHYTKAIDILRESGAQLDEEIQALNGLGIACSQQGRFEEAQRHFEYALVLSRESHNTLEEAQALNNLGIVAYYQRHFSEAHSYHRQALEIRRLIGHRSGEGSSLINLAQTVRDAGDYSQALDYLSKALVIQQAIGNRWDEANAWNDLGIIYFFVGDLVQAEACMRRALGLFREIDDQGGEGYTLGNLGQVLYEAGDLEPAERSLSDGLALAQTLDDKYLESFSLSHLGVVHLKSGNPGPAIERAAEALSMRQELGLSLWTTADLATLAAAYQASGDTQTAVEYAHKALAILDDCGGEGPELPQRDYLICCQVLSTAGHPRIARDALESAHALVLAKADKITDPVLRRSFLEQVQVNREIVRGYDAASR